MIKHLSSRKMLNKSKGPAVHSLRAQADKAEYTKEMRKTLQNTDHLSIRQAEVAEILTNKDQFFPEDEYHEGEEQKITGVRTVSGESLIIRYVCFEGS